MRFISLASMSSSERHANCQNNTLLFAVCMCLYVSAANVAGTSYLASVLCYPCCPCIIGTMNRGALRDVIGIEGNLLTDFCCHLPVCALCALCQEINEVSFREGCNYGIKRGQPLAAAQA